MTLPQPMPFFSAAANFAAGNDTPREFLERCLSHVEKFEPAVGAFVCHDIAAARVAADRSPARWHDGRPLSPIDGMPLGIKDIIETADMPTEKGSPPKSPCSALRRRLVPERCGLVTASPADPRRQAAA
jgi:Asp-tRNA(Asn)/Glu-tRNA(Gln) amidotransferase A subunit family amidase